MVDYEFYLNENGYLIIPEYDIQYLVSIRESDIPIMPELVESAVKIAGTDGDVVLSSNYESMKFTLVAYTDDNLTPSQKVTEINKMTAFMESIKKTTKKFALLDREMMYDVKNHSQLNITRYPMHVKFEIPLKASKPYGKALSKTIITGNGTANSNTVKDTGCVITINGPAQNPVLALNNYQMKYNNVILEGNKLIIDTKNSTVTHETSLGVRTNAAVYYNHEYPKIKYGNNTIAIQSGIDDETQVITEWYDLKI